MIMLFTSYEFIGFLILVLFAYYVIPRKFQWMLLLVASYIFYAAASPKYLIYILVTTLTTYYAACLMDKNVDQQTAYLKLHKEELSKDEKKAYKSGQKKLRCRYMVACILLNVGILVVVKYTNFMIGNINSIAESFGANLPLSFVSIALPMGISFYTFMALSYLIDVYRGTIPAEKNPFKLALFVCFFPHIIQGPISRFGDLSASLFEEHTFDWKRFSFGLQRVAWGFFKKLVIADRIVTAVMTVIDNGEVYSGAYAFVGMVFYTIELYADFTGGIDVTIGIAQMLGIKVTENFERPYFSKSLKEYWRRWHITMCSWFRDYIFYPVSTSKMIQKFSKFSRKTFGDRIGKRLPVYVSSFIVWFTTGIWHGASWNFIVWGLLNFAVLMISEEFEPLYDKFHKRFAVEGKTWYKIFQIGRTFLLVCILNLFDCYVSVADTFKAFGTMLTAKNWSVLFTGGFLELGLTGIDYAVVGFGVLVMLMVSLVQRSGSVREKIWKKAYPVQFCIWFGLFLCILLLGAYGVGYDASQFIYNRF